MAVEKGIYAVLQL